MGWADCGTDSKGRPIGYAFDAKCDHPGCNEDIDRGLSYACGGMHGELEVGCEGYFCSKHRTAWVDVDGASQSVCDACKHELMSDPDWSYDEDEEEFRHEPDEG